METNNITEIKNSLLCYGCGVCNVVCHFDAIKMKYDNIGRLQPDVNLEKCTDCGFCKKLCPSLDVKGIQLPKDVDPYVGNVHHVYIGKSRDERIYRNSQSGGLVTAILSYLFDTGKIDGAIVCKVDYAKEYVPKAIVVTSTKELYDSQKSSYVPIDMVSAIKQTSKLVSLAVVGTGCHIQGFFSLENFKKEYKDKIKYKLGLICDRTLCKTITDVIGNGVFINDEKKIIWRDKSNNYKNAQLIIKLSNGKARILPRWHRFVLKDPFTNPRCRLCFDKLNVHSDIVLGDPWGMSGIDWKDGMSVVLTRTETGSSIIQDMLLQGYVMLTEAPLSEVITGQHIEKRKKTVSAAIEVYEKQKWLLPSYAEYLKKIGVSQNVIKETEEKILAFVFDSIKGKEYIIQKNCHLIRSIRIKKMIESFFHKISFIARKIIKR